MYVCLNREQREVLQWSFCSFPPKGKNFLKPPPHSFSGSGGPSGKHVAYMYLALDKGGDILFIIKDGQSLQ